MATANKITSANHLPGEGNDRFLVYSKQFNALVDVVNTNAPTALIYRATLTQSGTSAPVATVLENTLGGTVTWSYTGVGDYLATLTGAFPTSGKVFMIVAQPGTADSNASMYYNDANSVAVSTGSAAGVAANAKLSDTAVEIRVYS